MARNHFAKRLLAMRVISASFSVPPAQIPQMRHLNLVVRNDLNPIHSRHSHRSRQTPRIQPNPQSAASCIAVFLLSSAWHLCFSQPWMAALNLHRRLQSRCSLREQNGCWSAAFPSDRTWARTRAFMQTSARAHGDCEVQPVLFAEQTTTIPSDSTIRHRRLWQTEWS